MHTRARSALLHLTALSALLGLSFPAHAQQRGLVESPTRGIVLPDRSQTTHGEASSIESNPAGLGFVEGAELQYTAQLTTPDLTGVADSGHAIFTALGFGGLGLGFGAQWLRHPDLGGQLQSYRKFSFGAGFGNGRTYSLGVTHHLFGSDTSARMDALRSWDVGLQLRYSPNVGFSLFARDVNAPFLQDDETALQRHFGAGFAFRAWDGKLIIDQEVSHQQNSGFMQLTPRVVLEPIDGLRLFGRAQFNVTSSTQVEQSGLERAVFGLELSLGGMGVASSLISSDDTTIAGHAHSIWFASNKRRPIMKLGKRWVLLNLNGALAELPSGGLFSSSGKSFVALMLQLDRIARDPDVEGVVFNFAGPTIGYAQAWELRQRIAALHRAKKHTASFLQQPDNKSIYIASATERVWMLPNVTWQADGLAIRQVGYQGALKKLGVEAEFLRIRDYKTAPETFIAARPSKESVEQTTDFVDFLYRALVDGISTGRQVPQREVKAAIDSVPILPHQARNRKLIDGIAYPDELEGALRKHFKLSSLSAGYNPSPSSEYRWGTREVIAVLVVSGTIVQGGSGSSPLGGESVSGSDTLIKNIRTLADDNNVRAVVVRVDSPGGSAFASDLIYRELRRLAQKKPVIASMGNIAASGGYYVSAGANEIFASPNTLTGSIGIFAGSFNVKRLATTLGFHISPPIKRGAVAGGFSMWAGFTPKQRQALGRYLAFLYRQFLQQVAHTRPLTEEQVDKVARGRVWTGAAAKQHKLVDVNGGLIDALRRAEALANLAPDAAAIQVYPRAGSTLSGGLMSAQMSDALLGLYTLLSAPADAARGSAASRAGVLQLILKIVDRAVLVPLLFRSGEALALPPSALILE